jgi:hypothetical protein
MGFLKSTGPGRARKREARPETAAKILGVPVDKALATTIDATGTRRRLQALAAIGWTQPELSLRTGLNPKYLSEIINRQPRVFGQTANKVKALYLELRDLRPENHGVSRTSARRVQAHAAKLRWPSPKYWDRFPDAIDDPHFTPEYRMTKAELLAEEATFLVEVAGLTRTQAAIRLGKDKSYVDRVLGPTTLRKAA